MAAKELAQASLPIILIGDAVSIVKKRDLNRVKRLLKTGILFLVIQKISGIEPIKRSTFFPVAAASISQFFLNCFSWQVSLYVLLRVLSKYSKDFALGKWLIHPIGMFTSNCFHNYLMTHSAENIEPGYINLWLTTVPSYQPNGLKKWLSEFSSDSTKSEFYQSEQVSQKRLQDLPKWIAKSFQRQLPFVLGVYSLGFIFSVRKSLRSKSGNDVMNLLLSGISQTILKTMRTSAVLSLLPYCLTEFPSIYAHYIIPVFSQGTVSPKVKRNPFLHVLLTSIFSTFVFLQEPEARLRMMVTYTWWRVFEAMLRRILEMYGERNEEFEPIFTERVLSSSFTGFATAICLKRT